MGLAETNPYGRLDVLAYRLSERLVNELEAIWGVTGIWNMIEDYVEDGIKDIQLKKIPEPLISAIAKAIEAKRAQRT